MMSLVLLLFTENASKMNLSRKSIEDNLILIIYAASFAFPFCTSSVFFFWTMKYYGLEYFFFYFFFFSFILICSTVVFPVILWFGLWMKKGNIDFLGSYCNLEFVLILNFGLVGASSFLSCLLKICRNFFITKW